MFTIGGELLPKRSLAKAKSELMSALKKSCDSVVTERNLQKSRNMLLSGFYSGLQSNAGVAHLLGTQENFFGDYRYYKTELNKYLSINLAQVKSACQDLFNSPDSFFVSVWDKNSKK